MYLADEDRWHLVHYRCDDLLMGIRKRGKPKETGYPGWQFVRYVRRFGHVYAAFLSAKMQAIGGRCEPVKGPGITAIEYRSLRAVEEDRVEAMASGLHNVAERLHEIAKHWPVDPKIIQKLPSSALCD